MAERISLQQVIRHCLGSYSKQHALTPRQWQVCSHIQACRTEAMGGLTLRCDQWGYEPPHFFSCRDRHCPRCQHWASRGVV